MFMIQHEADRAESSLYVQHDCSCFVRSHHIQSASGRLGPGIWRGLWEACPLVMKTDGFYRVRWIQQGQCFSRDRRRMLWGLMSPADPLPEDILGRYCTWAGLKGEEWEFARWKVGKKYTKASTYGKVWSKKERVYWKKLKRNSWCFMVVELSVGFFCPFLEFPLIFLLYPFHNSK